MRRSFLPILMCLIFSAAVLQAQKGGDGSHGGAVGFHGGTAVGGSHGGSGHGGNGFSPGRRGSHQHWGVVGPRYGYGYGTLWPGYWGPWDYWDGGLTWDFPYWDYVNFPPTDHPQAGGYPYDQPSPYIPEDQSSSATMRGEVSAPPVESPKLIEVPLPKGESAAKPQPPTLFVLSNGEQLESRHYVLTAETLQIQIGRKQRTIPVSELNIDATVAANQKRGIELTVPEDRNSMFLSF